MPKRGPYRPGSTLAEKYEARVGRTADPDACWTWHGALSGKGYGRVRDGRNWVLAHRLSFELANGRISPELVIRHRCDNPPCTNPAHLLEGTRQDNNADMFSRGRASYQSQTACKRGHAFTEENTYRHGNARHCRQCRAEQAERYKANKLPGQLNHPLN